MAIMNKFAKIRVMNSYLTKIQIDLCTFTSLTNVLCYFIHSLRIIPDQALEVCTLQSCANYEIAYNYANFKVSYITLSKFRKKISTNFTSDSALFWIYTRDSLRSKNWNFEGLILTIINFWHLKFGQNQYLDNFGGLRTVQI